MATLEVPATFTEFSALDKINFGGTLLFLEGRIMLLEEKSSEELSILTSLRNLGLVVIARLRRVTKRPTEGG